MDSRLVIALIRHADYQQPLDVPSAMLPHPLTVEGFEQARKGAALLAQFLDEHSLSLIPTIDSSRMLRAWQTATVIANELEGRAAAPVSILEFDALAERSVGAVANLTVAEIDALLTADPRYGAPPPGWKSMIDFQLPFQGAESLRQAGVRVAGHIDQYYQRATEQAVTGVKLMVGHGASIRHAALALGVLAEDEVARLSMLHATPVFIARDESGWHKVAGDWKPRNGSRGGND